MAARGHAHWPCADDGIFARRTFEPGETRAASGRQKRQSRREHLCESNPVRADGRPLKVSAGHETGFEIAAGAGRGCCVHSRRREQCIREKLEAPIQHLRRRRKIVAKHGRRITARAFSRRDDGGGQAVQHRAAGRRGVRTERFSAGGHHQTHGGGFEFSGENHRRADVARTRRPGDEFAQQVSRCRSSGRRR